MIGLMRHRVTIAQNTGAVDEAGGQAASWSDVATLWARIDRLDGAAGTEAARATDTASIVVLIRHRDDVKSGMRLTWRGDDYRIRSVSDPGLRGRWLTLACSLERTAA